MPLKKYVNGSWVDSSYRRYETGTDVVTSLPVTVYGDGETDISLLMKGNTETSGTPSPQNPVTINGTGNKTANLFDYGHTEGLLLGVYINQQGQTIENSSYDMSYFIEVQPNTEYTWSFGSTVSHNAPTAAFYDSNGDYISVATHGQGTYFSFTTPNNAAFVRVPIYISTKTAAMLNTGSTALPYEPYGLFKISISSNGTALTPIYVSQELYKLGDYFDSINSSGTATYYIVKKVLDGTETWTYVAAQSGGEYYFRTKLGNYGYVVSDLAISTHYSWTNITSSTSDIGIDSINSETANLGGIAIRDTNYANATAFAAYLAQQYENGTPVIVWYVLTTPTTESVTVPEITTTGGTATIDVDTTVKPSELDLTYHGWHTHEPLKRENGSWS